MGRKGTSVVVRVRIVGRNVGVLEAVRSQEDVVTISEGVTAFVGVL